MDRVKKKYRPRNMTVRRKKDPPPTPKCPKCGEPGTHRQIFRGGTKGQEIVVVYACGCFE